MTDSKIEGLRKYIHRILHCLKSFLGVSVWNSQVRYGNNFDILYVMANLGLAVHLDGLQKIGDKNWGVSQLFISMLSVWSLISALEK